MRGSRTGRPIMLLLDVLGQRWTLRILWELRTGAHSFRALRAQCDMISPTVLNQRLRRLRDLGLVALDESGFALTASGRALGRRVAALDRWANDWAQRG